MTWVAALREHAKITGKFAVPKKGTPEYDAVKKIQDGMANPTPECKAEAKKATCEQKVRKARRVAESQPSAEEIAARGAREKAEAKAAAAKTKAEELAAKAAAKAAKAAKEIADAELSKSKAAKAPRAMNNIGAPPVGPAAAVSTVGKPRVKISPGSGVSIKADQIVEFA